VELVNWANIRVLQPQTWSYHQGEWIPVEQFIKKAKFTEIIKPRLKNQFSVFCQLLVYNGLNLDVEE